MGSQCLLSLLFTHLTLRISSRNGDSQSEHSSNCQGGPVAEQWAERTHCAITPVFFRAPPWLQRNCTMHTLAQFYWVPFSAQRFGLGALGWYGNCYWLPADSFNPPAPLWGHHGCRHIMPSAFRQSSVLLSAAQPSAVKLFTARRFHVI